MKGKIKSLKDLKEILELKRQKGKKIVFTNGCFDLLHVGHVRYLEAAKGYGDILVVALNSDASVKGLKGQERPLVPQEERAEVLAGLGCIDYVVIFDEPDPLKVISELLPDVLVKGGDYQPEEILGKDVVEAHGGKVIVEPMVKGKSTTKLLQQIQRR